ncbi:MAG: glycine cleavage system protein GcvH [Synergistaceae bacterium]|nr:glycine cleavage system protein GcvH [Synergistaceae bacterium]
MIVFRDDVLYTSSNEWAKNIDGIIRVGIDDYSQSSLGDIVYAELSPVNTHVSAGKSFGSIEATKSVIEINAPVSGVIVRVNDSVIDSPQLINHDPFGEGWLIEIEPENISELDTLMNAEAYKDFIR